MVAGAKESALDAVGPKGLSRRTAALVACGIAMVAALLVAVTYRHSPPPYSDFDYWWLAGRMVLQGENPYAAMPAVGRGGGPFFYPLATALVAAPFALLPLAWGRVLFAALSGGLLAYGAARAASFRLLMLASAPVGAAIIYGQWSPLLTAAALLPAASALWVLKPTIGLALFVGYGTRWAVTGGSLLIALSFLVMPGWVNAWLAGLGATIHIAPVLRPGGLVLLLALLRWRRPEARMLVALACVPQMSLLYEAVPLLLIPQTRRQALASAYLGFATALGVALLPVPDSVEAFATQQWPLLLVGLWVPALVLVLVRPNVHDRARSLEP